MQLKWSLKKTEEKCKNKEKHIPTKCNRNFEKKCQWFLYTFSSTLIKKNMFSK